MEALAALRRIADAGSMPDPPSPRQRPVERCELCGTVLAELHRQVVELDERRIVCACRPCGLLFDPRGAGAGRYRLVPDRVLVEADEQLPVAVWDSLELPVGVAFIFYSSSLDRPVACYPGPAGATESMLTLSAWTDVREALTIARALQPDVEALLVRRDRARAEAECLLVPIDVCYELVGRLRMLWRGFDGGSEAAAAIDEFFTDLQRRARPAEVGA